MQENSINLVEELDNASKIHFLERDDIEKLMVEFGKRIVKVLKIERINVWLFTSGGENIISVGEYDAPTKSFSKDHIIRRVDFPSYFDAISRNKIILVPNVYHSPITKELSESYFKPNKIISLMDIPLRIGGELIGIICFEKVGIAEREFNQNEQTFALSLSLVLASNFEARYRRAAQKKLDETLIELESLNTELESFSYSVSHDLKAPLRAVMGYTEILKDDYQRLLDDDGKIVLDKIQEAAARMNGLIDGLLKLSKLGKGELNKPSVDMDECARKACDEIKELKAHTASITQNRLLPAHGDVTLLRQVWTNLISNAIKYSSGKKFPKIEIGCYEEEKSNTYFVKDNGAGFDMKYVGRLFGVFQRLHSDKEFQGNGIGLSIVRRVVAKHGGRVWAEATPGEGATFYFSLPK